MLDETAIRTGPFEPASQGGNGLEACALGMSHSVLKIIHYRLIRPFDSLLMSNPSHSDTLFVRRLALRNERIAIDTPIHTRAYLRTC